MQLWMQPLRKAHWNCHGICNCHCRFCYGMFKGHHALSTTDGFALIDKVAGNVEEIVFGGGDPLLRTDLPILVRHARNAGMRVEIQTNAQLLTSDFLSSIESQIARWGLSLDSIDPRIHDQIRGRSGNHKKVQETAALLVQRGIDWNLRTLVARPTLSTISPIGEWLESIGFTGTWYLLQYTPLGDEMENRSYFEVSDIEFHASVEPMALRFGRSTFTTVPVPDIDRQQIYFLMAPDGSVYNHPPPGKPYVVVGNILQDTFDALATRLCLDLKRHCERYGPFVGTRSSQSDCGTSDLIRQGSKSHLANSGDYRSFDNQNTSTDV